MVLEISLALPTLPSGWSAEKDFKVLGSLSKPVSRTIEPVGPHFLAYARRKKHKRTFSEDDRIQAAKAVIKVEDEDDGEISEPEDPDMLLRDAKDWKRQDHYAVLGLSKYRYKATDEQIKKAHRKKVLRHHPDKKAAAGRVDDDSFFKCIQKANEILTDPIRRKQWDSVDEGADVPAPTKKEAQAGDYYDLWGKFFEAEARFSKVHPVPAFGDENSTRDEVEGFYNFFYTFDSWRSFEYQDEDVPDDNENRDQKRQTEKKNMNARRKKKTEDTARLRKMVDEALANDERIKKFRKEGKKKSKKQVEREEELARAKAEKDAEEAKKKEAEAAAAAAHAEAASAKESAKKAKEAAKNAAKKNKRTIRNTLTEVSHFGAEKPDNVSTDVDFIVAGSSPEQLAELVAKINGSNGDADKIKAAYSATAAELVAAGSVKKEYLKFF